jgi:hypothetical protein
VSLLSASCGTVRSDKGYRGKTPLTSSLAPALAFRDPESEIPFARALYDNDSFMSALFNALSESGILMMQLGEAADVQEPPESLTKARNRATIRHLLARVGFESLHVYEEPHAGFGGPWTYMVAMKSYSSRKLWFANEAQVQLEIQKRIGQSKSGELPLKYFDGPTMVEYQIPNSVWEKVFCLQDPPPEECETIRGGFDPNRPLVPTSLLEVRPSSLGDHAGRGLFATSNIPKEAYVALDSAVHPIFFPPSTIDLVESLKSFDFGAAYRDSLAMFLDEYGRTKRTQVCKRL